jgi:hypothetical protein
MCIFFKSRGFSWTPSTLCGYATGHGEIQKHVVDKNKNQNKGEKINSRFKKASNRFLVTPSIASDEMKTSIISIGVNWRNNRTKWKQWTWDARLKLKMRKEERTWDKNNEKEREDSSVSRKWESFVGDLGIKDWNEGNYLGIRVNEGNELGIQHL